MRIPLASAALCQDCQCISDSLVECECGSKAMMTLSAVLNRDPLNFPLDFAENRQEDERGQALMTPAKPNR